MDRSKFNMFKPKLHSSEGRPRENANFRIEPLLPRNDGGPKIELMHKFYTEGVIFVECMPRFPKKLHPRITQTNLFILGEIISEHQWYRRDAAGEDQKGSMTLLVNAKRIHTRNGEVIYDYKLKQHDPIYSGHSKGYVKRINKKWKKLGLMHSEPRTSSIRLLIGRATYYTVARKIIDAREIDKQQRAAYLPALGHNKMPMHFVNGLLLFTLY